MTFSEPSRAEGSQSLGCFLTPHCVTSCGIISTGGDEVRTVCQLEQGLDYPLSHARDGPALKNAQMCIPAVAGHPGPLRGTLPSAGLVENIVSANGALLQGSLWRERERSRWGSHACTTSSVLPPHFSCHSGLYLETPFPTVLVFLTDQWHS